MAKAFLIPTVVTSKLVNFSLEEMAKRLKDGPNVVRVGLPDTAATTAAHTAARPAGRGTRTPRKGKRT